MEIIAHLDAGGFAADFDLNVKMTIPVNGGLRLRIGRALPAMLAVVISAAVGVAASVTDFFDIVLFAELAS